MVAPEHDAEVTAPTHDAEVAVPELALVRPKRDRDHLRADGELELVVLVDHIVDGLAEHRG